MFLPVSLFLLLCSQVNSDPIDEIAECMPRLADRCFADLANYIQYQLRTPGASLQNVTDFCSSTSDCLECAKDVIDTDCDVADGKENFDLWLSALTSVDNYLCQESTESLQEFLHQALEYKGCWNLTEFVMCVEEKSRVTHVVDMLRVAIDINECNWLLIAFSTCNVQATKRSDCTLAQKTVNELIHIFLQETKCTVMCSGTSSINVYANIAFFLSYLLQHTLYR